MLAHHPLRQVIGDRRRTDSLLRVPGMRGLVIATLISSLGSSAALLAVAWVSYQHSDSIVHAVIVATAFSIPAVLLGPTAGRLAETHQRRQIIAWCYVGHMAVWNGVAFLDIIGWLTPAWLALATLLGGTCSALRFPSWQQFERSMVPDSRLHEANALFVSVRSLARIVGAVVGGFVITWVRAGLGVRLQRAELPPLRVDHRHSARTDADLPGGTPSACGVARRSPTSAPNRPCAWRS